MSSYRTYTAEDAKEWGRQLEFADKRHGILEHPLSLFGAINQLGHMRDLASVAGDTDTMSLLDQAIERRRAIGRKRRLQSALQSE